MTDKEKFEQYVLEKFSQLYHDFPLGEIIKSEAPDFLITRDSETIGVEISKIVNEKSEGERFSPSERNAIEQKISQNAKEIFLRDYKIPLYVVFDFHDGINVGGGRAETLACELAKIIGEQVKARSLENYFDLQIDGKLPRELMQCSIAYFPEITESIWYSSKSLFIPNLSKEQILKVVAKKEQKLREYQSRADRVFLLLVEGIVPDSWFDQVEFIESDKIKTDFDKVFILRNLSSKLMELKS